MKYVAFLRGINVGGRIIKMSDLKTCFEAMGFKDASTLLQSGNVVFESGMSGAQLKQKLELGLAKTFNYPAKVQVFALSEIQNIIAAYPFDYSNKDLQHYVVFFENGLAKDLVDEAGALDKNTEEIKLGTDVIYWQVQKGMTIKSPFSKYLVKAKYKDFNTTRNLNTVAKITKL